jgi:hypothetical protein
VSTKEALFLACVRYADGREPLPEPADWPLPAPGRGELLGLVSTRLAEAGELALSRLPDHLVGDPAEELTLVVTDLLDRLRSHRRAIKLVDRCAPEIPELGELWFGTGRAHLVTELATHLRRRAAEGVVRDVGDESHWYVVARTVVETCVMWAVHLEWDPAPAAFRAAQDERHVAEALAGLFAFGLVDRPATTTEE